MKRYLFLTAAVVLLLGMLGVASAVETNVAYDDLPQAHRALYERAMAAALAEAPNRVPSRSRLQAMPRGDFNGYTDQKSDGSLRVEYRVSDSVVRVGEKIKFYVNMNCDAPPMTYTVSGLVFDEAFNQTGSLNSSGSSIRVDDTFKTLTFSYTPTTVGYVNFVLAVSDGKENQVAVVTSTVMVCEEDDPIFQNQSVDVNLDTDGNLGLMLSLDRAKVSVGTVVTAQADVTTTADPVRYRGIWTLTDEAGNILDVAETSADTDAQDEPARLNFPYRPLQAGKLQFVINASDGEGNRIKTNTPVISVADGLYLTARLSPTSALMAGETLTAVYDMHGHDCGEISSSITWECCDADGNTITSTTRAVSERSAQVTCIPRIGQMVEFRLDVTCEHFKETYPATARIALVGGLEGEVSLTATTVLLGGSIGMTYAFEGGLEPYQKVVVKGYTVDRETGRTVCFLEKTLADANGTVMGSPEQGDQVYFTAELVEADGYTSTWTTDKASVSGAAVSGDADGSGQVNVQDVLRIMQYEAGWPVQLNAVNADLNGSGGVELSDVVKILRDLADDAVQ